MMNEVTTRRSSGHNSEGYVPSSQASAVSRQSKSVPPNIGRVVQGRFEGYVILGHIQECLYGHVMAGVGLITGDVVAIKSLKREDTETKHQYSAIEGLENGNITASTPICSLPETPLAEVFFAPILKGCKNVAIIREVIGCDDFHFVVSDFANGEDLLELLKQYPYGLPVRTVQIAMRLAAEGLASLHSRNIALQDFSLENCLLSYDLEGQCQVKICDPGQAVIFAHDRDRNELPVMYKGCVGKKFRPPEIFTQQPYRASKVDAWCLGWSTWYFLFAAEVFESVHPSDGDPQWILLRDQRYDELFQAIDVDPGQVSPTVKDFLFRLLDADADRRMSVAEALDHPFLSEVVGSRFQKEQLPPPTVVDSSQPESMPRMALTLLSLTPHSDRPGLLRAFAQQLPTLKTALENGDLLHKPLHEVRSRSRTIKRLFLEAGPLIPHIYFSHYIRSLCIASKPSSTLIQFLNEQSQHKSNSDNPISSTENTPHGHFTTRASPTSLASTFRNLTSGSIAEPRPSARLSPRGLCGNNILPLTRPNIATAEHFKQPSSKTTSATTVTHSVVFNRAAEAASETLTKSHKKSPTETSQVETRRNDVRPTDARRGSGAASDRSGSRKVSREAGPQGGSKSSSVFRKSLASSMLNGCTTATGGGTSSVHSTSSSTTVISTVKSRKPVSLKRESPSKLLEDTLSGRLELSSSAHSVRQTAVDDTAEVSSTTSSASNISCPRPTVEYRPASEFSVLRSKWNAVQQPPQLHQVRSSSPNTYQGHRDELLLKSASSYKTVTISSTSRSPAMAKPQSALYPHMTTLEHTPVLLRGNSLQQQQQSQRSTATVVKGEHHIWRDYHHLTDTVPSHGIINTTSHRHNHQDIRNINPLNAAAVEVPCSPRPVGGNTLRPQAHTITLVDSIEHTTDNKLIRSAATASYHHQTIAQDNRVVWAMPTAPSRRRHERDASYRSRGFAIPLARVGGGTTQQQQQQSRHYESHRGTQTNSGIILHTSRPSNVVGVISIANTTLTG